MNAYLLSIIGTVLLSAVLTAIIPEGKTSSIIRSVTKFVCVMIIVSPILKFFNKDSLGNINVLNSENFFSETVIQSDNEFIKYYSELRIHQAETALEKKLEEKYSIPTSVCLKWREQEETTALFYKEQEIKILKIIVKTEQECGEEVKNAMWEYLTKNYCSEVLIE